MLQYLDALPLALAILKAQCGGARLLTIRRCVLQNAAAPQQSESRNPAAPAATTATSAAAALLIADRGVSGYDQNKRCAALGQSLVSSNSLLLACNNYAAQGPPAIGHSPWQHICALQFTRACSIAVSGATRTACASEHRRHLYVAGGCGRVVTAHSMAARLVQ